MDALPAANLLDRETSPYLLQHKDNPVHWRAWGPESLAEAQRLDRPIMLSTGYSACHWCHVMAHESFEDAETAAFLNENFVNIKLDREERPDIDGIFQTTLQALGQQGGWPVTMFLTSLGEPFTGGTYFPKTPRPEVNRPSFMTVLQDVSRVYREQKNEVAQSVGNLKQALDALWTQNRRTENQFSPVVLDAGARRICQAMDVFSGGVNGAQRFPQVPLIEAMWRAFQRSSLPQFQAAVETQLRNMCLGGIYDHLGGGFARYTTDEFWMVPHFEKMLSDNAQIIEILTYVWQFGQNPLYKSRIEETVAWLQREMLLGEGAFAAALDADSEGVEGKFYAWTPHEIAGVVGADDARLFCAAYDVRDGGNFAGGSVLHRLRVPSVEPVLEGRFNAMRQKLFQLREKRIAPARDNKILADWNGLAIAALTQAAEAFHRLDWQALAVRAFWFVAENMSDGGKLFHSYCAGKRGVAGMADDYAQMARAALKLFEATADIRYLELAKSWVAELDRAFWDQTLGGYCQTSSDEPGAFAKMRAAVDGSTPSANGTMVEVHAKLFYATHDQTYRARAVELINVFAFDAMRHTTGHASLYNGFDTIVRGLQIVLVGDRSASDTQALRNVLRRASMPHKLLMSVSATEQLPLSHPAHGKPQIDGKATAYVCNAAQCSQPLTEPNQLETMLKTRPVAAPAAR